MDSDAVPPYPNLKLADHAFVLGEPNAAVYHEQAKKALLEGIEKDEMAPYFESLVEQKILEPNPSFLAELQKKNTEELEKLDAAIQEAETGGQTDVSEALVAKAVYLARIGNPSPEQYTAALEKLPGLGSKIDARLALIRIGLFHNDQKLIAEHVEEAEKLVEEGGDWDRRNRLKAYQGVHYLSIRNFRRGSELLIDVLSTFGATELLSFEDFVALSILSGVLTLSRPDLLKKIIESPEVIQVAAGNPLLRDYAQSLYKCEYAAFFKALATIEETHFVPSRLLAQHTKYYVREMRIKAYAQILESYRSVTLENLATAFGVTPQFVDADLAKFIASGRLSCSIDRVNGIVETHRADGKNAKYESVIKQGDVLLTSIQRLSRVIN